MELNESNPLTSILHDMAGAELKIGAVYVLRLNEKLPRASLDNLRQQLEGQGKGLGIKFIVIDSSFDIFELRQSA